MIRLTFAPAMLAITVCLATPLAAFADDASTHTLHSKQMSNDAGVKEGDKMKDAVPKDEGLSGVQPMGGADNSAATQGTHTTHSKEMKNDMGAKDGDKMNDTNKDSESSKSKKSRQHKTGKAMKKGMHSMHDKQMKNDSGVKDGEEMKNAR